MSDNWENVAKAVKRARRDRGWSIRDACAAAELSPTTWINAEKGMRVSELTQSAIAKALGWERDTIDRLLSGEDADTALDPAELTEPTNGQPVDLTDRMSSLSAEDRAIVDALIERLIDDHHRS